jgi:hypothetical protein
MDYSISTGLSIGFYIQSKGKVFANEKYQLIDFTKNNFPFNKTTMHFLFFAGAEYKLNQKIHIIAGGSFKYQLDKILKSETLVNKSYYSLGLKFGLKYYFR